MLLLLLLVAVIHCSWYCYSGKIVFLVCVATVVGSNASVIIIIIIHPATTISANINTTATTTTTVHYYCCSTLLLLQYLPHLLLPRATTTARLLQLKIALQRTEQPAHQYCANTTVTAATASAVATAHPGLP